MIDSNTGLVIRIGERYFSYVKNDRLQTAWSLAGAKIFRHANNKKLENSLAFLDKKKKRYKIMQVYVHEHSPVSKEALGYT